MTERLPILGVDFDGVCHMYTSGWKGVDVVPDGPVPGLVAFLAEAVRRFRVCIYSSRSESGPGRDAMRTALGNWIHQDLGDAGREVYAALEFPEGKPPALVSIDDRVVCFDGNWPSLDDLAAFKPWNKRDGFHRLSLGPEYERDRAAFLASAVEPTYIFKPDNCVRGPFVDSASGEITLVVASSERVEVLFSVGSYVAVVPLEGPERLARVGSIIPSMDNEELSVTAWTRYKKD